VVMFSARPSAGAPEPDSTRRDAAKSLVSGLFTDWYGPLVRYARRATGSLDCAEDIVQASFMELYRALLCGKAITNPRAWTLSVVKREIVDRFRERGRHGGVFLPLSDARYVAGPHSETVTFDEEQERLTRLLAVLSQREEEVLLLRVKALKYRQIAVELKISVNSVKTLLARAMRKMQRASAAAASGRTGSMRDDTISDALQ